MMKRSKSSLGMERKLLLPGARVLIWKMICPVSVLRGSVAYTFWYQEAMRSVAVVKVNPCHP
jgi:hypothetical protein